ncbi:MULTISPECIES: hypothetical protein [Nostoc]|uniref:Uncharacterized protein n=1 Tax=Nostoc paludosum FACHB-159 TaxID=2692908 RepID=A0ABR8K225_9NOSO|nr:MULTISPECIES: hypothetical protein [Nostoc]MBD2682013.1 hypothetical protein [Nostoc sp. FACHB-857]MBD2732794.1 hypothetical protein [Nostoc paludosum FACHB-159]
MAYPNKSKKLGSSHEITKKGTGQKAFMKGASIKTLLLGLKPSLKKDTGTRGIAQDTKRKVGASAFGNAKRELNFATERPCFNPTFKNVGSLGAF